MHGDHVAGDVELRPEEHKTAPEGGSCAERGVDHDARELVDVRDDVDQRSG